MAELQIKPLPTQRFFENIFNRTHITSLTVQAKKNCASSVTDLQQLLKAETGLLGLLAEHKKLFDIATKLLEAEGFTVASIHNSDVRHPVDGFNLIKRLGLVWPKVVDALKLPVAENWEGLEGAVGRKVMRQLEREVDRFPSWEENQVNFWLS